MPSLSPLSYSELKSAAVRLGFTACGVAPVAPVDKAVGETFHQWLLRGGEAGMNYLKNHVDKRLDPGLLVEGAKSIISVALNYYPSKRLNPDNQYEFAWYAYGHDYHEVMKSRLTLLAETLQEHSDGETLHYRVFCDTAPVLERYWAWRCGLGWIGKNTQLIIPRAGSAFFLGEIILDRTFSAYDMPVKNRCGSCIRCIEACPTRALETPYRLDAARCLSYLTIEFRGETLPSEAARTMGNCIYGCDRCQQVCPWNRFSKPTEIEEFVPKEEFMNLSREKLRQLSLDEYRTIFRGSAVKRAKYEGLMRNLKAIEEENQKA